MKAKTKRRKVWVNFYKVGSMGAAHESRKDAALCGRSGFVSESAVPFIESRPGDVVLSREDADRLRAVAREYLGPGVVSLALDLLRGGR